MLWWKGLPTTKGSTLLRVFRFTSVCYLTLALVVSTVRPGTQNALANSDTILKTVSKERLIELDKAAALILRSNPEVIFVGDDHTNPHLANGILVLLSSLQQIRPVDCLFVEFPIDLQKELDSSLARLDAVGMFKTLSTAMRPAYLAAFERMGYDANRLVAVLRNIDAVIERADVLAMNRILLNGDLFGFLRVNDVQLLAYNVESTSKELFDAIYFKFVDELGDLNSEQTALDWQGTSERSAIMADNIVTMIASNRCANSVIIVGQKHLLNQEFVRNQWGRSISTTPIQTHVEEDGHSSIVVTVRSTNGGLTDSKFIRDLEPRGAFDRYAGSLLTP